MASKFIEGDFIMRDVVVKLIIAILMELALAWLVAPFYMQIFPIILFLWVIYEITIHTKIIKIQTSINLPKDLRKQIEKHVKQQMKDIDKKVSTNNDIKTKDKEKE